MLALLHLDALMTQVMDGVMKQTTAMMKQMGGDSISPEMQAQFDEFQKKTRVLVDAQMGWKVMEPTYIDLYAKTFTDEELDAIIAFYKSPAGASMVAKTPMLTAEAQKISQEKMLALQPQLTQLIQDFIRQVAASAPTKTKQN